MEKLYVCRAACLTSWKAEIAFSKAKGRGPHRCLQGRVWHLFGSDNSISRLRSDLSIGKRTLEGLDPPLSVGIEDTNTKPIRMKGPNTRDRRPKSACGTTEIPVVQFV